MPDYELTLETLREMLERAYSGESPKSLLGEMFWDQTIVDDDEFGCCGGGVCDCE